MNYVIENKVRVYNSLSRAANPNKMQKQKIESLYQELQGYGLEYRNGQFIDQELQASLNSLDGEGEQEPSQEPKRETKQESPRQEPRQAKAVQVEPEPKPDGEPEENQEENQEDQEEPDTIPMDFKSQCYKHYRQMPIEMYVVLMRAELGSAERPLFEYFYNFQMGYNSFRQFYPRKNKEISEYTGITNRNIKRTLKNLCEKNMLIEYNDEYAINIHWDTWKVNQHAIELGVKERLTRLRIAEEKKKKQ